ncbi:MAG TPA: hypothetical protein VFV95_15635 [Vicinamibacterales bacterium]|nr:hypothetical protein [Vicinamibacterales bacterium]
MPTKVNLPDGRVVNFPDTMTQEQILGEVEKLTKPAPSDDGPTDYNANLLTKAIGAGRSVLGGIGQGVVSTVLHIDDAMRGVAQRYVAPDESGQVRRIARRLRDNPDVQALVTPYNTPAAVGKAAEQIAEFAIPSSATSRAVSKLPVVVDAAKAGSRVVPMVAEALGRPRLPERCRPRRAVGSMRTRRLPLVQQPYCHPSSQRR